MSKENTQRTCNEQFSGSFEIKGSKFLSFLFPIRDFKHSLQLLRDSHPKAVHFVSATRFYDLQNSKQINESFSDDGEPKGSSGVPILNVLRGENLIDVGCVVVRYFGGIKLGVGGLVRAYTQSVQECIKNATFITYLKQESLEIEIPYSTLSKAQYHAQKLNITLHKEFKNQTVRIFCLGDKNSLEIFKNSL